ncbi:MAG: helix-turn-helix domain-containing protein [Alphaproteobacteria bacterium]|nr:helix-turn-helix domain-containing protein [Alphaproteobacteria bacterium]
MAKKPNGRADGQVSAGYVKSLDKALALLEQIGEIDDGLALSDLAQRAGLPPSTAHRLLTTLERRRFVQFDNASRRWCIGVQAFTVGSAFLPRRDLIRSALPFMRQLMEESGETTNLAVESNGEAVFLAHVESHEMMRASSRPGSRVPLHGSGVGKALLSTMPEREISRILHKHGLRRLTPNTIVSPAELRVALAEVREIGYGFDNEEHSFGVRCVAAPIFDERGEAVAAISVLGPTARISDERVPDLGARVCRAAKLVTAELGGTSVASFRG